MVQFQKNIDYDIVLTLLREPSHVRGIAKSLSKPHTTVLRRMNALVSRSVIDSKTEGRNRVFSIRKNIVARNVVYAAEHYKLIRLLDRYPDLAVVLDDAVKRTKDMLIIFGSYAKFQAKPDSDIDVYISATRRNVKAAVESVHSKLSVKTGKFDLASGLIREIVRNHVIVRGVEEYYDELKFFA